MVDTRDAAEGAPQRSKAAVEAPSAPLLIVQARDDAFPACSTDGC